MQGNGWVPGVGTCTLVLADAGVLVSLRAMLREGSCLIKSVRLVRRMMMSRGKWRRRWLERV